MNTLDLTKVDFNQFYATRNGYKVKLIANTSTFNTDNQYPVIGYLYSGGTWDNIPTIWTINGKFSKDRSSDLDIIGMWEGPQPEVTITLPAPLNKATEGQEVWYLNYEPFNLDGYDVYRTCAAFRKFRIKDGYLNHLLEIGQLFATKEDAQAWLDAMKGAKR